MRRMWCETERNGNATPTSLALRHGPGPQAADPASGKGGRVQYAYMPGYTKWEYPGNSGAQGVQALAARGAQRGQRNHGY